MHYLRLMQGRHQRDRQCAHAWIGMAAPSIEPETRPGTARFASRSRLKSARVSTSSKAFIAAALPHYHTVTAFSDAAQGERGVIYRAAGFVDVGASRGRRVLVHCEGKIISERRARGRFGTASAHRLAALGFKVETVPRRCRYIALRRGTRQSAESSGEFSSP
jgi:hypothetical protein